MPKTHLTRSRHMKGTNLRLWVVGYYTVPGWQTAWAVVKLTWTRLVCDWVEAVRHGEASLRLEPSFKVFVGQNPVLLCPAFVLGNLQFSHSHVTTAEWKGPCGVAYVLLKEREPDLWDDEKVAMLSTLIFVHTVSITLASCILSRPTITPPPLSVTL